MRAHGQSRRRAQTFMAMFLLIPLGIVASACSSAAGSSATASPTGATPADATSVVSGTGVAIGAPVQAGGGTGGTGTAAGGGGTTNAAMAYPFPGYIGTSGVAADHTIVVTGVGDAPIKADGSNRAAAQRTALTSALADAKAQADLVAEATGVTIHGVVSVSVASGQTYAYPMMAGVEGSAPGAAPGGATVVPPVPGVAQSIAPRFEVSVTVAYQIG